MKKIMIAMLLLTVCISVLMGTENRDKTPVTEDAEYQEVLQEPQDILISSDGEGNVIKKYVYLME